MTNEVWGYFDKPNSERVTAKRKIEAKNKILINVLIDASAFYRTDLINPKYPKISVPTPYGIQLIWAIKENRHFLFIRKLLIEERIQNLIIEARNKAYSLNPELNTKMYTGCAQMPIEHSILPVKLICFGI
jgi:hypothetical protein